MDFQYCGNYGTFSVATFISQNFRPEELTLAQIANIEALADDEGGTSIIECSSGPKECVRVFQAPNTVHIFYKP